MEVLKYRYDGMAQAGQRREIVTTRLKLSGCAHDFFMSLDEKRRSKVFYA
jgi:hypothetical protein